MPWTPAFLAELERTPFAPRFRLQFISLTDSLNSPGVVFTSTAGHDSALIAEVETIQQTVEPYPGRSSTSEWRVTLAGSMKGLLEQLVIGSHAVLRCGFPGWLDSNFERIALGRLKNILRPNLSAEVFILTFDSIVWSAQSRLTIDVGQTYTVNDSKGPLFFDLRDQPFVTLNMPYNPGDPDLTINPGDDLSIFEMEEGATGLLRVESSVLGSSGTFYLEWTAAGGGAITLAVTGGQHGTTDAAAGAGASVFPVALMRGHPADIARKVWTSTGAAIGTGSAGSGGAYDLYPESWGIDPSGVADDWFDHADIDAWRDEVIQTSTATDPDYQWEVIAEDPQDSGIDWLLSHLGRSGILLVERQGDLTIRALQDMDRSTTRQVNGLKLSGVEITDYDILLDGQGQIAGRWEGRDSEQAFSSRMVQVLTNATAAGSGFYPTGTNHLLPIQEAITYDQSGVYISGIGDFQPQTGDALRLLCWHAQPREMLELCLAMRCAALTVGDVVLLTTDALYGRLPETAQGYAQQPAMVLSHRVRWLPPEGPSVEVRLAIVRVEPGE